MITINYNDIGDDNTEYVITRFAQPIGFDKTRSATVRQAVYEILRVCSNALPGEFPQITIRLDDVLVDVSSGSGGIDGYVE